MVVSADTSAPLVVVVGATGVQGGSVIKNLIESNKPYRLRGLTRDSSKPAALQLKQLGVGVTSVSISVGNGEAVREAFAGAEVVFGVTNYLEHHDKAREIAEGKLMVDAAKAVGAKLFVWSGLEDFNSGTNGKYARVYPFDSKAEVTAYAFSQLPSVDIQAGFYTLGLAEVLGPRKLADGSYLWDHPFAGLPIAVPYIDAERDYGLFVRYAIETPAFRQGGKTIYAFGDMLTGSEVAAILRKARGITLTVDPIALDKFLNVAKEKGRPQVFLEFYKDLFSAIEEGNGLFFGKEGSAEQEEIRRGVGRRPRTFEEFLHANPEFLK
ncbi:NAD(P)-binding protein [Auricularia subglabra TFB-10046 SS5]|nr:NAD(P)-binding protein [Auricularia subglabra TFB-10046 SS5]